MELRKVSGEKSFKIIRSHAKVFLFYTWVKVDPMTMNEQRVSCKFGAHETDCKTDFRRRWVTLLIFSEYFCVCKCKLIHGKEKKVKSVKDFFISFYNHCTLAGLIFWRKPPEHNVTFEASNAAKSTSK